MTDKTDEVELKTLATDLKKATDEVKKFAETVTTEMKNLGDATKETKASADKAISEMNAVSARLNEVEQKMVRAPGNQQVERKSLGQMVVEDKGFTDWTKAGADKSHRVRLDVDIKTVNSLTSGTTTVGGTTSGSTSLVVADRAPFQMLPERRMTIRDLLTPGNTTSGLVEYAQQTAEQNMAAPVAEGSGKPQSDMSFNLVKANVATVATFMKASRQILDDAPQLQSMIDNRLRYMLAFAEEGQFLNGDGTGVNLLGIVPQASAYSAPFSVTDETAIDRLRLALLQGTLALYPSTGIVLHPTDWTKIEMTKDSLGRYIIGDPYNQTIPRLWGLPVVATPAMTATNFLTGAFKLGAQIFDRMGVEVLISTEDGNNFTTNMVTIRGEERTALAVYVPAAFVTGTLP